MAKNRLQQYFPMIRSREEVIAEIEGSGHLRTMFYCWREEQREEFLDFCTGVRGVKVLYDAFFKEIFNPEIVPERLERLLSILLGQKVKLLQALPNDSTRIADEQSLLVTDLVVELENGSLANIEVQKIGYLFPGQRAACYGADLLLRQYKRVRSREKGKRKKFSYKDIKDVYIIVFFEKSTEEFHKFPESYCHSFSQKSETGLEMKLLQEYRFIPLDIFRKNLQNKGIRSELDAWLAFLSEDDPGVITSVIEAFPEFRAMYEHVYNICRNTERLMQMFSRELQELDRNTVQYMIDELQEEVDRKKAELAEMDSKLAEMDTQLETKDAELETKDAELETKGAQLEQKDAQLEEKETQLAEWKVMLGQQEEKLDRQAEEMERLRKRIAELEAAGRKC